MEIAELKLAPADLARLAESDHFVRQAVNAWRGGVGHSLGAAVHR